MTASESTTGYQPARAKQRGVALVTILVVVALASLLAAALISSHRLNITHASALLEQDRATNYALSGVAYARALLRNEIEQEEEGIQHRAWRQWRDKLEVDEGKVFVRIEDMQGLFNLNALGDEKYLKIFNRLLEQMQVDPRLAPLANDWLDTNNATSLYGAEDNDYLLLKPPFRTANTWFHSVLELGILGRTPVSREGLVKLYPLLTTLPAGAGKKFNVNSMHPLLLRALAPGQDAASIVQTIGAREVPFRNAIELQQALPQLGEVMEYLEFSSKFFRADVYAQYRDRQVGMSAMLYRQPGTGETRVLSRQMQLPQWLKLPDDESEG